MPAILSVQKHSRAAAFAPRPGPSPHIGRLEVRWANAFDRSCFLVADPELEAKCPASYHRLLRELMNETGCTKAEILAHGRKVRSLLASAEDHLRRTGELAKLHTRQKYPYALPAVRQDF